MYMCVPKNWHSNQSNKHHVENDTYYCKIVTCVNVWTTTNKNTRYYYKKCTRDIVMVFYLPFVFRLLPHHHLLKIVTTLPSSLKSLMLD